MTKGASSEAKKMPLPEMGVERFISRPPQECRDLYFGSQSQS
jgi:hypothetical protein